MRGATWHRVAVHACLALLAVACLGTALVLVPGGVAMGYDRFALPKELAATVTVVAAALVWITARRTPAIDAATACLFAVVVLAALSLTAATNQLLAVRGLGVAIVTAAAYATAAGLAAAGRREALCAIIALAAAGLAATAIGEAQGWLPSWSLDGRAPGGSEGNRNFLGHGVVVALPVALVLPFLARHRAVRGLGLIAVVVVVWALVLTRSRGAWLGAAASTAVVLIALAAAVRPRRQLALVVAALAAGVIAALAVPNQLHWRSPSPYADTLRRLGDHAGGSGRGRLIQYAATADMIAEFPWLGVGPGNWSVAYPAHARPGDPSHNPLATQPVNRLPNSDWLGLAAERGLPALLLLVGFAALLLRAAWRGAAADRELGLRAAALSGVLAAVAVCGTFDAVLLRPTPALLAAVALGALARPGAPLVRRWAWPWRAASAVAVAALLAGLAHAGVRTLDANRLAARDTPAALRRAVALAPGDYRITARLAAFAGRRRDCAAAIHWARATLASYPHHTRSARLLADCRDGEIVSRAGGAHHPTPPAPR